MTSLSDADLYGFRASDIYDFLDIHGLKLNREAKEPDPARPQEAVIPQNAPQQGTNGSGERFSFSSIAAAKRAEFISYREAMTKLRESTGDALKHVAAGLKSHGIHEKHMAYLAGPEQAVRRITGSDDLTALLDETIENGGIIPAWVGPDDQVDPERSGWMRREFVAALRSASLPCPDTLLDVADGISPTQETLTRPDWVGPYIGRPTFSLAEASAILAGFAPIYGYDNRSEDEWRKIEPWCRALVDAIDNSEEISASTWGSDRSEQNLSHADIRAWCERRGHGWPIPGLNPQPTIDSSTDGATPSWLLRYEGHREIPLGDAAVILAGFEPLEPHEMWSEAQLEKIIQWEHVLDDGIESGQIGSGADLDAKTASGSSDVMLDHADLHAWCFKRGHDWPIPAPAPLSAPDAELAERLSAAEAEIDRLRMVEAESVALRRHLDTAIASLADANARLAILDADNSGLTDVRSLRDEIGRLKELVPPRPEFLIPIVVAVQKQFWADWDASKPRPKAVEEIQPWINSNFPQISGSNALVQAVEKVACPFNRDPSAKR